MLDSQLIDPIAKTIAKALLRRFVEGDRIVFSICGSFDKPRWPLRTGTVTAVDDRNVTVRFDDEHRSDMLHQKIYVGNSSLKRLV
jgi:hypothetical protein